MKFSEVISRRFSVRAYQPTPVEDAAVQAILEAANSAPSSGNLQAYEIIVIRDVERKRQLAKAALEQWFIAEAPVVLVFLANLDRGHARYGQRGADVYCLQDATIACAYSQLAATALGLGACWVGAFDEEAVRDIVGAPEAWRPVAILPVGVPAEAGGARERRALSDLVHDEQVRSNRE